MTTDRRSEVGEAAPHYDTLRYAKSNGVAWITLDRPGTRNALDARMRLDLLAALRLAGRSARAVVLTGAGEAFCAGQTFGGGRIAASEDLGRVLREELHPVLTALVDCPVPTIAAVNGLAAGWGAGLALAADIAIAAERAAFVLPAARVGLSVDAGASYWMPTRIGSARTLGAALLAEPIPARQAAEWGLIWEAVADTVFVDRVVARAQSLASGPTAAYAAIKTAVRDERRDALLAALAREAQVQAGCARSRDFAEALVARAEGRPPVFEGR